VYAVVMALDSVEVAADIELGGLDQLLNMRMCRRVMATAGQPPEVVLATALIEGTDGSGAKMSKSRGNVVGVTSPPAEVFGRLMSAPDRLLPDYLRALTELLDPEVDLLLRPGHIHPMGAKTLLASDVTAAVHGDEAAARTRARFAARFSRRRLSEAADLPVVDLDRHAGATVGEVLVRLTAAVPSLNQVRRVADGGGLRLVVEAPGREPARTPLTRTDVDARIGTLAASRPAGDSRLFLRCGRAVVELR
jgi:tyrosyl-tRNA synthetase